ADGSECKQVSFHVCSCLLFLRSAFALPFKGDDRTGVARVTFSCFVDPPTTCNHNVSRLVLPNSVDAILATWMILMQARWLKLRSGMTMKRLANWFGGSIRWWRNWCGRIVRDARPRRTFVR